MKRRLGLKGKSIMFTTCMAVLLGLLLGGYGYYQLRSHQMRELERWGRSTADALARNAAYAVFTESVTDLDDMATGTVADEDVLQVVIANPDGEPLSRQGSEPYPALATAPSTPRIVTHSEAEGLGRRFEIVVPVRLTETESADSDFLELDQFEFSDEVGFTAEPNAAADADADSDVVGQVLLTVSHARVEASLSRALRTTAMTTLLMLLVSSLVAMVFMGRIVRPLADMTEVAERMAGGDFSRDFSTAASSGEVRTLVGAFGAMKESVRKHTEELYRSRMKELSLAHEEVMRANKELLNINRRKSAFLADMSHELRTPLNGIIGFADMMHEGLLGELNDEQQECAGDILSSGRHLLTLINDILDIAKIEAGKAEIHPSPVDVTTLVEEVTTAVRGTAYQKNLKLVIDVADELGVIEADERRLKQVLINLLSNAVKYTPEGSVTLRAWRERVDAEAFVADDSEQLVVSVRDTGVGIDPEQRDRVFSEFDRVDNKYSREQEGTGLGLALCKKLVELHGGTVDFESVLGEGTEFVVRIPWRAAEGEERRETPVPVPTEASPVVLVIEDDIKSSAAMAATLESHGYRVEQARTAAEGLVKAEELSPAVITLDLRLPDQTGWNVLSQLRDAELTKTTPVVIMSALDQEAKGLSMGASAYLVKPVERERFLGVMSGLIAPGDPGRILAIDDDVGMLQWYEKVLANAGWTVETAGGGDEGISSMLKEPPDVVVLDLMMREVSGFDVLDEIRKHEQLADVPVIVVTAKDLDAEDRQRLAGDVERIMQKGSFSSRELVRDMMQFSQRQVAVQED